MSTGIILANKLLFVNSSFVNFVKIKKNEEEKWTITGDIQVIIPVKSGSCLPTGKNQ